MKVSRFNIFMLAILFPMLMISCSDDDDDLEGNWVEGSDFDGVARGSAAGFVIDGYGYLGTGFDGDDRWNDFWRYDPDIANWTEMAEFPGVERNYAVGFSVNGKGYIGLGYDGDDPLSDFYEYDPSTNTWTQIADFPGSARYDATAFAVDGKGYVGTGYDDDYYLKDFYSYDPSTGEWEQILSIPGSKRRGANSFVIDGKAYVISGLDNGSYLEDVYCYDPSTESWTEMREINDDDDDYSYDDDYVGIARRNAATFVVNGLGYLSCGSTGSILETTWEYDPVEDLWEERTEFEGVSRTEAIGFSFGGDFGYVTTGRNSSYYFDDLYIFDPTAEYDEDD